MKPFLFWDLGFGIWDLQMSRAEVWKGGVGCMALIQLATPIDTVIAYRVIYLVSIEVYARRDPIVVPRPV